MKELIEQYFGERVSESGDNWRLRCVFHDEKTPSLYIHKEDLIGHCFGCGISGTLEGLLARKLRIPVKETRALLGISITRNSVTSRSLPKYFPESWLKQWNPCSTSHLTKRGISSRTTEKFGVRLDVQARRVVFPLREYGTGKLTGAAGRAFGPTTLKWYFYWNCNKSANIYLARSNQDNKLFLVEGIFDALRLYEAGYNGAALLGSKSSNRQTAQILNTTQNVVLALDNDNAGREGNKLLEERLRKSCTIQYLRYPTSVNDISDLSEAELQNAVSNLVTPLEYKLELANV